MTRERTLESAVNENPECKRSSQRDSRGENGCEEPLKRPQ